MYRSFRNWPVFVGFSLQFVLQMGMLIFLQWFVLWAPSAQEAAITEYLAQDISRDFRSPREAISWKEFREKVRNVLPGYTLARLKEELAEQQAQAPYIKGDWQLGGAASYKANFDPNDQLRPSFGGTGGLNTHRFFGGPEISKKILFSGTTLGLGFSGSLQSSILEGSDPMYSSTLVPKFSVKQDLLQNFFGLLDRFEIADAQRKLDIAKEQRRSTERQLQQSYDKMYANWILLWRNQQLLSEQLRKSQASLRNAQEQRRLNYIDNGTYQQFYNSHLLYQQTLLNNEKLLLAMDQRFVLFFGAGVLYRPDIEGFSALLEQAKANFEVLKFENSWNWAISQKSLERVNIRYSLRKWQRLPSLVLGANFTLESGASYKEGEAPSYSKLKPGYEIDLKLSWPILGRKAKNASEKLRIQLQELERTLEQQREDFEIDIARRRGEHLFSLENYQIQQEMAKAKAAIYVSNQVKYEQARASIRDLLDAEIQSLSAELTLLKTESELLEQMLDYRYQTREQDIF